MSNSINKTKRCLSSLDMNISNLLIESWNMKYYGTIFLDIEKITNGKTICDLACALLRWIQKNASNNSITTVYTNLIMRSGLEFLLTDFVDGDSKKKLTTFLKPTLDGYDKILIDFILSMRNNNRDFEYMIKPTIVPTSHNWWP